MTMSRRSISFSLLALLFFCAAGTTSATKLSPANIYKECSGDPNRRDLYIFFAFNEKSCLSCLSEIRTVWCALSGNNSDIKDRIGMAALFRSRRKGVSEKMAQSFREIDCSMPFYQDSDGRFTNELFNDDDRAKMIITTPEGSLLLARGIGDMDEFSEEMKLDEGPDRVRRYIDSLLGSISGHSGSLMKQVVDGESSGGRAIEKPSLKPVRSIILEGTDSVGMPFSPYYSPEYDCYSFISSMTNGIYKYDANGKLVWHHEPGTTVRPSWARPSKEGIYFVAGIVDTVIYSIVGEDTNLIIDNVIKARELDGKHKLVKQLGYPAKNHLSVANDIAVGKDAIYLTRQRAATATYLYHNKLEYQQYLGYIYDSANYARFIDSTALILEMDKNFTVRRTYGRLPGELKRFGFKRSHFWLEFNRSIVELADGSVAYLHAASPIVRLFRDGKQVEEIDITGEYYQPITGREQESEIPHFTNLLAGEDGKLYAQYRKPLSRKEYIVVLGGSPLRLIATYEAPSDVPLIRVDGEGQWYFFGGEENLAIEIYRLADR